MHAMELIWSFALRQVSTSFIVNVFPLCFMMFIHDGLRIIRAEKARHSSISSGIPFWFIRPLSNMSSITYVPIFAGDDVRIEGYDGEFHSLFTYVVRKSLRSGLCHFIFLLMRRIKK